jgi:hypothetical protein
MKQYRVRFTPDAEDDLLRLYDFLLEKDLAAGRLSTFAFRSPHHDPLFCIAPSMIFTLSPGRQVGGVACVNMPRLPSS